MTFMIAYTGVQLQNRPAVPTLCGFHTFLDRSLPAARHASIVTAMPLRAGSALCTRTCTPCSEHQGPEPALRTLRTLCGAAATGRPYTAGWLGATS